MIAVSFPMLLPWDPSRHSPCPLAGPGLTLSGHGAIPRRFGIPGERQISADTVSRQMVERQDFEAPDN